MPGQTVLRASGGAGRGGLWPLVLCSAAPVAAPHLHLPALLRLWGARPFRPSLEKDTGLCPGSAGLVYPCEDCWAGCGAGGLDRQFRAGEGLCFVCAQGLS